MDFREIFGRMIILVKAKPSAHEEYVRKIDETNFIVSVKEPPIQGRANRAIINALATYFNTPISNVRLVSGFTSRQKMFEILEDF